MFKWLAVLALTIPAFGQTSSFYQFPVPLPGATFRVCPVGTQNPCPSPASIFSDQALTQPISQPAQTGPTGQFGFFIAGGQYTIQIGQPYNFVYIINLGGSGGGGGTINPTNGAIPVRANATTFNDSPLSAASGNVSDSGALTTTGPVVSSTFNTVTESAQINSFVTATDTAAVEDTGFNQVVNINPAGASATNVWSYVSNLSTPAANAQNFSGFLNSFVCRAQHFGTGNLTAVGTTPALGCFVGTAIHQGNGTITKLATFNAAATNQGGGTISNEAAFSGVSGMNVAATGTTTTDATFLAAAPGLSGSGGTMTHHYAFRAGAGQTGGTGNADGWAFFADLADKSQLGLTTIATLSTSSNCAVNSVSPAACGSAPSGAIVIPTTTTTYVVNTTSVTANSRILLSPQTWASNLPSGPTCVAPAAGFLGVSASTPGTSFTITLPSTTGTVCLSYWIIN